MDNRIQVRITQRVIIAEGRMRIGDVIWLTPERARELIDQRAAVYAGAAVVGPALTKPAEPAEKKFSSADPAGRSTDSAESSAPGTAEQSSALPADPASPRRKSRRSKLAEALGLGGAEEPSA